MNLGSKLKKVYSLGFSILFHLLLLIGVLCTLDHDRTLPTSTKGYQVELIHAPDNLLSSTPDVTTASGNSVDIPASTTTLNTAKAEINLKTVGGNKKSLTLSKSKQLRLIEIKHALERKAYHESWITNKKQYHNEQSRQQTKQQQYTKISTQHGVTMTNKNQAQIVASAPTGSLSEIGSGSETNSSTDGNGTQTGTFDFRVIEYGRDAAYAINQNIIIPDAYRYTHVTYRAFVVLDRNMQFQSMHIVSSTGSVEFDNNIAKALRETVYPPLPHDANWHQFHNIDFTIK